jgi:hypothetical protein
MLFRIAVLMSMAIGAILNPPVFKTSHAKDYHYIASDAAAVDIAVVRCVKYPCHFAGM